MIEATKTILNSDTIPRVEVEFMNDTHFEEIQLVKNLGELISSFEAIDTHTENDVKHITQLLQHWFEHTIAHFEQENKLMQETNFPAYGVHFGEHEIALNNMKSVINTWEEKQDIQLVADYVFTQWPNWFNSHVSSMDMATANFAVMNGFDSDKFLKDS